jgi:hypothetical protein
LGYGIQASIAVAADFGGAFASNLQLRVLPTFAILGAPFAAYLWLQIWQTLLAFRLWRPLILAVVFALFWWFSTASLLKGTLEPSYSNFWIFYKSSEEATLKWFAAHGERSYIWTDFDQRLNSYWNARVRNPSDDRVVIDQASVGPYTRFYMISDVVESRAARFFQVLPDVAGMERLYDNGPVAIYHPDVYAPVPLPRDAPEP